MSDSPRLEADLEAIDWDAWLRRWDEQQQGYLPEREERFSAMLDVLDILFPSEFLVLDLACGPGAVSQRLLTRFDRARAIAVDLDPVLLTLGRRAVGTMDGRLQWIEADLLSDEWPERLSVRRVDAVVTTTALHWLPADRLVSAYHHVARLLQPGGVLLNGDHYGFARHMETFARMAETWNGRRQDDAFANSAVEDWKTWWESLRKESGLEELFLEREKRFGWREQDAREPNFDLHVGALSDAGFREIGTIWQVMDNRVLMAVR